MLGWVLAVAATAATPAAPPPDPLGRGYLGVQFRLGAVLTVDLVQPNTPAERAGLEAGDVIVRVGALLPDSQDEVIAYVKSFRPGATLRVVVRRGGEERVVLLRLMARPASADAPRFGPP